MALGGWFLAGWVEIELTPAALRAVLRLGPLRWSGRRPRARVRQFTVERLPDEGASWVGCALAAECDGARRLYLVFGYPRDWVLALADDLAGRCGRLAAGGGDVRAAPAVRVAEQFAGRKTSRGWRPAPFPAAARAGGCLFFGPFFVVGCLLLVFIVSTLARDD